jgi:hypothetical protein
MRPTHRRTFLNSALYATAALAVGCAGHTTDRSVIAVQRAPTGGPSPINPPRAPHYVVLIVLEGGYDPVLTFDPKDQDAVGSNIDCQYYSADRLQGRERLYGPLMAPLLRHESDMCIIHGVRVDTVGHADGLQQIRMGRKIHSDGRISAWKPLADGLPGDAPFAILELPQRPQTEMPVPVDVVIDPYTLRSLVQPDRPSYGAPPFFAEIQAAQLTDARHVLGHYPKERKASEAAILGAGNLHTWLARADSRTDMVDAKLGPSLQFVTNAIKYNRARFSIIHTPFVWFDSHADNLRLQKSRLSTALHDIALFVDLLKSQSNDFGSLYDQTTIVIGTEMGRYPKLNSTAGKDHWPENSWVMLGKGVKRGATIGRTDDMLRGSAVDPLTGRLDLDSVRPLQVDTIGATLTKLCGGDLRSAGYADTDVLWPVFT